MEQSTDIIFIAKKGRGVIFQRWKIIPTIYFIFFVLVARTYFTWKMILHMHLTFVCTSFSDKRWGHISTFKNEHSPPYGGHISTLKNDPKYKFLWNPSLGHEGGGVIFQRWKMIPNIKILVESFSLPRRGVIFQRWKMIPNIKILVELFSLSRREWPYFKLSQLYI
jgi:hypothetical protein